MKWLGRAKAKPDAQDVAVRAIILKHVIVYALTAPPRDLLKEKMSTWSQTEREEFEADVERLRQEHWSALGSLCSQMSPWEVQFSRCTVLTMSEWQQINASWRTEAFQVLLWALSLGPDLSTYDTGASHELLKGFPPQEDMQFVASARLRPKGEIENARDTAELWHWRSRTRQIIEDEGPFLQDAQKKATGFEDYHSIVRSTAGKAASDGVIPFAIDEDFPAFGKAYRELAGDEWAQVRSITMERHFALNWLCGYAPKHNWDETPTDT